MTEKNKGGRPRKKHPGGRPRVMTPEVIKKLEDAYLVGATDIQAAFYAGITTMTIWNYCKQNPEFIERRDALRKSLGLRAKRNIALALENADVITSKWVLERTEKETYADRTELTAKDGEALNPQTKSVDEEVLANYYKNKYGEKK